VGLTRSVATAALVALLTAGLAAPAGAVAEPIVNTVAPTVTGAPTYRETLTAAPGTWTPVGLTFTYQWLADGQPIAGRTSTTYRPGLRDLGARISVAVTATDPVGAAATVLSPPTMPVVRAELVVEEKPAVTGVPRFTRTVTAADPVLDRRAELGYRWLRDDQPVRGARDRTYQLGVEDVGHRIRVQVTARRDGYRTTALLSRARTVRHLVPTRRNFSYHVETRGDVTADLAVFRRQAQETFDDPRGWRSAGVGFRRVAQGGDFTLVMAVASAVPGFSGGCSAMWSCRVGRFVIINQTRWATASPAWNAAGRSRRDYRHLVVNHETGHWLGHGHRGCAGDGPAPVMMQQSKGTRGCTFNPWPLPSERWVRR
jgi:Protein of unknown function (DUF3152)